MSIEDVVQKFSIRYAVPQLEVYAYLKNGKHVIKVTESTFKIEIIKSLPIDTQTFKQDLEALLLEIKAQLFATYQLDQRQIQLAQLDSLSEQYQKACDGYLKGSDE